MYDTLLPVLYSRVRIYDDPDIRNLVTFVHTILRNPTLAKVVHYLDLDSWDGSWKEDPDIHNPFEYDGYDANLIENADYIFCLAEERWYWIQALRGGLADVWLIILIPKLTNLRGIKITWPYGEGRVLTMFSRAAEYGAPLFPHLEEVFAEHCDTKNSVEASWMVPFFKFPAMRKLSGRMITDHDHDHVPGTRIQPCSGIEEIDLDMSNTEYGFCVWIQSCIALKSFRLEIGGPTVSECSIQSHRLRDSLSYHKTTLEKFWLRTDKESNRDLDEGWIGSFADFSALKMLHIPFAMLADFDEESATNRDMVPLLPPFLESLYLCQCDYGLINLAIDQVEALLGSRCLPNLTSLGLECSRAPEAARCRLSLISKRCEEAGITFVNLPPEQRETRDYLATVWPRSC
jgi:hypothetical protein